MLWHSLAKCYGSKMLTELLRDTDIHTHTLRRITWLFSVEYHILSGPLLTSSGFSITIILFVLRMGEHVSRRQHNRKTNTRSHLQKLLEIVPEMIAVLPEMGCFFRVSATIGADTRKLQSVSAHQRTAAGLMCGFLSFRRRSSSGVPQDSNQKLKY